jgi:hypothetical protein
MKRHEWWRQAYRDDRDLEHLSPNQLSERLFDCINNSRVHDERGRLGIMPFDDGGEPWMVWQTEVLEECVLRNYDYPGPLDFSLHRNALEHAFDPVPDVAPVLEKYKLTTERAYLLKFGDPFWLRKSLQEGSFRIAPASFYDAADHNHARRDTEMKREITPSPKNPHIVKFMTQRGIEVPHGKVPARITIESPTDYYLFSLSTSYNRRLFGDFAATGCLVIHTPAEFMNRLRAAVTEKLSGWLYEVGFVRYYDPVRVDPQLVDAGLRFMKPFRHAYQSEIRFTWTPRAVATKLEPFEVKLGSLEDIAELVDHENHPPVILPPDPADAPIITYGKFNEDTTMVNTLPDVARMQGMLLSREADNHRAWFFKIQYTDEHGTWHEVKVPMLDGLYLLNMFRQAEKEQHLELWNRAE